MMVRIRSAKGTLIFDDECIEYDFIMVARLDEELTATIRRIVAGSEVMLTDTDRGEYVGAEIYAHMWGATLDALPQPGPLRGLLGRYLEALDWDELGQYYVEQAEQEGAGDGR